MWIAAGRIVIDLTGNDNLTVKHRQLDELCALVRKKFNVSMLEVADHEIANRAVLGFAGAIPESWKERSAQDFIESVCRLIDKNAPGRVMVEDTDLLVHGEEGPMEPLDAFEPDGRQKGDLEEEIRRQKAREKIMKLRQKG